MAEASQVQWWEDFYFTSRDGLRLYARRYPARDTSSKTPVLCLAGLTRNSRDFHDLAISLSQSDQSDCREVWAIDCRGRGRSAFDPDWRNYALQVEMLDVLDLMTIIGLSRVHIVGTSRGGLLAMIMGSARPGCIASVVLNDIGPVIEREGLLRIIAYVGRVPLPATWAEATAMVREMNADQFSAVPDHQWASIARQLFNEDHDRPMLGYDPNIAKAISILDGPIPALWPQFQSLSKVPVMVIRGGNSDILSANTVREMQLRHPNLSTLTVNGQGHAPLLRDRPTQVSIANFFTKTDSSFS